jgi:hypothetical protein
MHGTKKQSSLKMNLILNQTLIPACPSHDTSNAKTRCSKDRLYIKKMYGKDTRVFSPQQRDYQPLTRKGRGVYKMLSSEIHGVSLARLKGIGKLELRHDCEYE